MNTIRSIFLIVAWLAALLSALLAVTLFVDNDERSGKYIVFALAIAAQALVLMADRHGSPDGV